MNLLAAIVNLLTLISEAIVKVVKRERYENESIQRQDEVERLHENPGKYISDMFGTRGDDSVRSDEQANKDLYYTRKADPPR